MVSANGASGRLVDPADERDDVPRGGVFRFGDCELDVERCELRRAGRVVRVQRKVFDLLAALLHDRDRLLTKDELLTKLWPDTHAAAD